MGSRHLRQTLQAHPDSQGSHLSSTEALCVQAWACVRVSVSRLSFSFKNSHHLTDNNSRVHLCRSLTKHLVQMVLALQTSPRCVRPFVVEARRSSSKRRVVRHISVFLTSSQTRVSTEPGLMSGAAAIEAGIRAGNINVAGAGGGPRETLELSESSRAAQEKHAIALIQLEAARRARTMYIPTDPAEIKARLRELSLPITLFGEGPGDRRDRLRRILGEVEVKRLMVEGGLEAEAAAVEAAAAAAAAPAAPAAGAAPAEIFYTPAPPELVEARAAVARFSFARAAARLSAEAARASAGAAAAEDAATAATYAVLRQMSPVLSQPADERPLSCCALSANGAVLATGSWGSTVRLWDPLTAVPRALLRGHAGRVVGVSWSPSAVGGAALLATASVDCDVMLWRPSADVMDVGATTAAGGGVEGAAGAATDADGDAVLVPTAPHDRSSVELRPTATLAGHTARLGGVAFHPTGSLVCSASYDGTWRMWDVATGASLLTQDGHGSEVYAIACHPDGSLVATGDLSGVGRLWDIRSGKPVWALRGHARQLLALDFSPMGNLLASGSDDQTSIVWELRQQRTLYTIPAHSGGLISRVK